MDYAGLRALAAVLEEGTFERAAERLGLTPSAISHRIRALESQFSTQLIVRSTPCSATQMGDQLIRHFERVQLLEKELQSKLNLSDPRAGQRARIRVVVNADSLSTWFMEVIGLYFQQTGNLLDIIVEDQDYAQDLLAQSKSDAVVSALNTSQLDKSVQALGILRYRATATPRFMDTVFSDGVTTDSLLNAPLINFNRKDGLQARWIEQAVGRKIAPPTHYIPSSSAFVETCLYGVGWAMNPEHLVSDYLEKGQLVELIPDLTVDVPLCWQISPLASEVLKELTDCVVQVAGKKLLPAAT
ncbi:LysR family transcriptional regulator ArgP [Flexibacterium corallicola]|uniref:LysR family transcriptional regulator ArgP n=1 Tax=Flexibacterium corallicola TaxID=3037259 RepID=UPI00286EBB47|nr:LysR family transcriptional regulator ArgP [Pseudovibrio sp. M1P-2-3]